MNAEILIIEDDPTMAILVAAYLKEESHIVSVVYSGAEGLKEVAEKRPACVLLDLNLPDMHGFDVLKSIQKANPGCATVVITGETSMSTAIDAMKHGAHDFVSKPISPERLKVSVKNALESVELKEIAENYQKISREGFQGFIGKSPKMQAVYTILESAAQSNASVFITGESGTGKELTAHAVHNLSARDNKPFEVLNCAAIPHNLLESEIFGHVKGAFTGATSDREGAASRANGGTLFLDELGEMPMDLQPKLLRFIQSGTFTPVGGSRQQEVDVRFICATNRNPLAAVKAGLLREDLYYRLNVIPVELPPLRERGDDIMRLAEYFLKLSSEEEGKEFEDFSPEVVNLFSQYRWAGNVRELENSIRRIVILNSGKTVKLDMLNALEQESMPAVEDVAVTAHVKPEIGVTPTTSSFLPQKPDDIKPLHFYEREAILAALSACDGNITETSKRLDINPATIHRKQKQWKQDGF